MLFRQNYRSTIANHRPPNIAKTWLVWYPLPIDNYVQAASQKLDKFITGTWWLFPKLGFKGLTTRDYLAIRTIFSSTDTVCTLQLRLKDFNFTANHQTFTISLIFPARELAPMPTFAEGVQVPEAVTPGSDARLANTCKVAEQATTSDASLPGRLAAAKKTSCSGKIAPKKTRVE
ncbi:hypothetical protein F2Q70_00003432 [Brassica cretica]|uniref:Uncharacterized protein n=1 Tax=Brassica cretica TaxID=69181 RepID=A0A8S9IXY1_BRACR|nr:hypothetical protein F2Q70_00003432 [Brassica cretica]